MLHGIRPILTGRNPPVRLSVALCLLAAWLQGAQTLRPALGQEVGGEVFTAWPQQYAMYPSTHWQTGYAEFEESAESSAPAAAPKGREKTVEERLAAIEKALKDAKEKEAEAKKAAAQKPTITPRGRLHTDLNYFTQSQLNRAEYGDIQDGAYFRRARLGFDAKMFEVTTWRLDFEMGSAGGRPSIFDAFVKVTDLPYINNVQLGHYREPFSLEALTSSNWLTCIERAANNTFDPSRNWGLMTFSYSEDEMLTWAVGVFRDGSDLFGDDIGDSGEWAGTARSTYLLYYDEPTEGRYLWEIGGSFSYRDPDNRFAVNSNSGAPSGPETSIVQYAARPEDNLNEDGVGRVPNLISVSITDATDVQLYGVETTANFGPLNLQSEFIGAVVDRGGAGSVFYHGTYVQASYFLTGETRRWERKNGTWGRAQVYEPFFMVRTDRGICTGWGAWELVARWNYLDLTDGAVGRTYGFFQATTLGFNWYLNPYVFMQFNYEYVDIRDGGPDTGGSVNVYHARWNMHF